MPPSPAAASAATRLRVLHAAWACVARAGLQATTAEVAAAAGCSPGTLFRHFPTREALLLTALDAAVLELTSLLPPAARHDTIYEVLRQRWEATSRRAAARPDAFRYWAALVHAPGPPLPDDRRAAVRLVAFAGADRALGAALGAPARGAWAAARLVANWAVTVEEVLAGAGAVQEAAPALEYGFAAWWAGLGLSRDTPVPAL